MLPFTVASYVRECLFAVGGQILAFRRDTDRFALSGFCAHPICEFLRVGVHESALLRDIPSVPQRWATVTGCPRNLAIAVSPFSTSAFCLSLVMGFAAVDI